MRFLSPTALVTDAQQRGYAVPAMNTNGATYDIARAALEAAQELQAPLILQVYEPNIAYRGFEYFVNLARWLADELDVTIPLALQLDHGKSFASTLRAMRAGFTAVMFDGSKLPLQENIAETGKIVEAAKTLGVAVEAEVGYVKGNEPTRDKQIGRIPVPPSPTEPPGKTAIDEAVQLTQQVDIDMLAVAIGTTHGVYQRQTDIDFQLLDDLRKAIPTPLVMHGTSGICLEDLAKLTKHGMAKINFGEPFRFNYVRYFNELTDNMEHLWHPWKIAQEIKNHLKADMKKLITALNADGKAPTIPQTLTVP